jgi:hypothetical protein
VEVLERQAKTQRQEDSTRSRESKLRKGVAPGRPRAKRGPNHFVGYGKVVRATRLSETSPRLAISCDTKLQVGRFNDEEGLINALCCVVHVNGLPAISKKSLPAICHRFQATFDLVLAKSRFESPRRPINDKVFRLSLVSVPSVMAERNDFEFVREPIPVYTIRRQEMSVAIRADRAHEVASEREPGDAAAPVLTRTGYDNDGLFRDERSLNQCVEVASSSSSRARRAS